MHSSPAKLIRSRTRAQRATAFIDAVAARRGGEHAIPVADPTRQPAWQSDAAELSTLAPQRELTQPRRKLDELGKHARDGAHHRALGILEDAAPGSRPQ
jgi:hypothetical protein